MRQALLVTALASATTLAPAAALATVGYFQHGYGIKAKGMGGVGIALPQDALAAATNPAGMAWVGNRLDLGVDWFAPDRGSDIAGNGAGLNGSYDGSGREAFLIPELGYNRMVGQNLALGVSVFGNGGMNTTYKTNPFGAFGGSTPAGVDLMQLFVAPTAAWKIGDHSVGASLNLAYQRFAARGLQPFDNALFSASPGNVTDRGHDSSSGWGVRFGWMGQVTPRLAFGATYQTRTRMGKLDKYRGLFAEQGGFDIPENYGFGIAFKPMSKLTIAGDLQRINYGKVQSVGNKADCFFAGACQLGASNGPGFGWRNTTVYKIGVSYEWSPTFVLRGGFVTLKQPIPENQTFLNVLAPGVVEDHLTLGTTWQLSKQSELSVSYMHAFERKVNGAGSIPAGFGGGEANLRMNQNAFGIAWGWRH